MAKGRKLISIILQTYRAECLLMYRLTDVFKITAMMFSERTGLKNAYAMVDYCINGTK